MTPFPEQSQLSNSKHFSPFSQEIFFLNHTKTRHSPQQLHRHYRAQDFKKTKPMALCTLKHLKQVPLSCATTLITLVAHYIITLFITVFTISEELMSHPHLFSQLSITSGHFHLHHSCLSFPLMMDSLSASLTQTLPHSPQSLISYALNTFSIEIHIYRWFRVW